MQVSTTLEECRTIVDVARLDGQVVRLMGTYTRADPLDIRKKQVRRPGEPPSRRAWIVLADGTQVLLEPFWAGAEANRPEEELQRFHGKDVVATGTILRVTPPSPNGVDYPLQTLCVPTLQGVCKIAFHA